jgi:hypothetical protein
MSSLSLASKPGSPPWSSEQLVGIPQRGSKWQVDERLNLALSWGGLSRPHSHQDFHSWERVRNSQSRPQSRLV